MTLTLGKRLLVLLALSLSLTVLTPAADLTPFFQSGKVRALILSGRNNHNWRATTPFLRELLVNSGRFDVRVCEEPMGLTTESVKPYQVLVLDYCGPRWGETAEKAVADFVRSGGGLVVVHGAIYTFSGLDVLGDGHKPMGFKEPAWPEFLQMVGGGWRETPPKRFHAPHHLFQVKLVNRSQAILGGMKEVFTVADELYHQIQLLPDTKVIATAYDDPENGGTGQNEPMLWVREYGKGRVFATVLGHEVPAMREEGFRATFTRGTEWAGTGQVTLPPSGAPSASTELRVLLVTGGHDYEASFYSVFEQQSGFRWAHATNAEAFKKSIKDDFDVLVLYDMTADLDDKCKGNLQAFVESGKGLLVLHHAIASYQNWPWYEKTVGGRYLLKPEGDKPASTYRHDEELAVLATTSHPITAGLGAIHIWDETYKGMAISPDSKVLLKTNNPTSDGPVAWISSYPKSRVVYIQLGHDGLAFRHPSYREIVRRAILWVAGKLEPNSGS